MTDQPGAGARDFGQSTRRVVTGHDAAGRSTIVSDADCPVVTRTGAFVISDAWRSQRLPADNAASGEPCTAPLELEPSRTGNVVRMVTFPPDEELLSAADPAEFFASMGESGSASLQQQEDSPHPLMHRSQTVDYIIIVSGEIYAVMETGETLLRQGDILIQRGTNHAWSNRTDKPCVLAAVLNAADALPGF